MEQMNTLRAYVAQMSQEQIVDAFARIANASKNECGCDDLMNAELSGDLCQIMMDVAYGETSQR